jgi:hypothetical protein
MFLENVCTVYKFNFGGMTILLYFMQNSRSSEITTSVS